MSAGHGDLGAVLAALGNSEAKALTFLAMDPQEQYGVAALHRLFMAMQGPAPVFTGTVNLPQKYCLHSFEPAGLVGRVANDRGHLRHVKTDPDGVATALAGHLLHVTGSRAASLGQIFGRTVSRGVPIADGDSPPANRLAVMRAVATTPGPLHQADLGRRTGLQMLTVGHNADALSRAGLLSYRTAPTYEMKSTYRVVAATSVPARGNTALHAAVVEHLNTRLAQSAGVDLRISRDEVEAHLRDLPRWRAARPSLRDQVQRAMLRLTATGQVVPLDTFAGQTRHTIIEVDGRQRRFLTLLVEGIDRIAAGEPLALARGTRQAQRIVGDAPRVCRLLLKGFGSSKHVVNPRTSAEKKHLVLAALSVDTGATTAQLVAALTPDLNPQLVRQTLKQLVIEGRARGEAQRDGPCKLWYLA